MRNAVVGEPPVQFNMTWLRTHAGVYHVDQPVNIQYSDVHLSLPDSLIQNINREAEKENFTHNLMTQQECFEAHFVSYTWNPFPQKNISLEEVIYLDYSSAVQGTGGGGGSTP